MKILVRHAKRDAVGRIGAHCETVLRRVLGEHVSMIDTLEACLDPCSDVGGQMKCRCTLTARLLSRGSVQACVTDCENILAVYRAAEKMRFCIEQRKKSG